MDIFHFAWQVPRDCVGHGRMDGILVYDPLKIRGMLACGVGSMAWHELACPEVKDKG